MITVDRINKVLDEAEDIGYQTELSEHSLAHLLCKALVFAIIYSAELISKSLRNR